MARHRGFGFSNALMQTGFSPRHPGNYYGTPKPPAEPSPVQPDLVDQVLFDEEFAPEVQRKRTTSVSKMDRKDSAAPEEEEEEERPPLVNGLAGETPALHVCFLLSRVGVFFFFQLFFQTPAAFRTLFIPLKLFTI